jgi:hypothetical protein
MAEANSAGDETEEFESEEIEFISREPKDLKRSIRDKYKIRLRKLAFSLNDFIYHPFSRVKCDIF